MWPDRGTVNHREFVSSWEKFTSKRSNELCFKKHQCLPFHHTPVKASAMPLPFPRKPEPNCFECFLKFVFPLADEPGSTLAIKRMHFKEAVSITSDQNAK